MNNLKRLLTILLVLALSLCLVACPPPPPSDPDPEGEDPQPQTLTKTLDRIQVESFTILEDGGTTLPAINADIVYRYSDEREQFVSVRDIQNGIENWTLDMGSFDSSIPADYEITLTYTEEGKTVTAIFTITVKALASMDILSLEVKDLPYLVNYEHEGSQEFDSRGLSVVLHTQEDDGEGNIELVDVTVFDPSKFSVDSTLFSTATCGDIPLTVSLVSDPTFFDTFTVNIYPYIKEVVLNIPDGTNSDYIVTETYNPAGISASLKYSNGDMVKDGDNNDLVVADFSGDWEIVNGGGLSPAKEGREVEYRYYGAGKRQFAADASDNPSYIKGIHAIDVYKMAGITIPDIPYEDSVYFIGETYKFFRENYLDNVILNVNLEIPREGEPKTKSITMPITDDSMQVVVSDINSVPFTDDYAFSGTTCSVDIKIMPTDPDSTLSVSKSLLLNIKQVYSFTSTVKLSSRQLEIKDDLTAYGGNNHGGSEEDKVVIKYVEFGDYPQTIKGKIDRLDGNGEQEIHVYDDPAGVAPRKVVQAGMVMYLGEDGCYYVSNGQKRFDSKSRYSNGVAVPNDGTNAWFKVEPIVWRVLDSAYQKVDGQDAALLWAADGLDRAYFYNSGKDGGFDPNDGYKALHTNGALFNNYRYSTVRAFLNGSFEEGVETHYHEGDWEKEDYSGVGFLQKAFGASGDMLLPVNVVNDAASSIPVAGTRNTANNDTIDGYISAQACENTSDKVFLLSVSELTNPKYYFKNGSLNMATSSSNAPEKNEQVSRIRKATDFALARGAKAASDSYSGNAEYWTRSVSPVTNPSSGSGIGSPGIACFSYRGECFTSTSTIRGCYRAPCVIPAICIDVNNIPTEALPVVPTLPET